VADGAGASFDWFVSAMGREHRDVCHAPFDLLPETTMEGVVLSPRPAGRISGVVRNTAGDAVAEALVILARPDRRLWDRASARPAGRAGRPQRRVRRRRNPPGENPIGAMFDAGVARGDRQVLERLAAGGAGSSTCGERAAARQAGSDTLSRAEFGDRRERCDPTSPVRGAVS
jgi:hypothetical protein